MSGWSRCGDASASQGRKLWKWHSAIVRSLLSIRFTPSRARSTSIPSRRTPIGGTVATNAGGIRVLRHGMTRANVLGLEAVLADGRVISRLGKLAKDNSGFDLKQLFIGSEGTLGMITRVVLQLQPAPAETTLALVALPSHDAALDCLVSARAAFGTGLVAFEGMWPDYWDYVCHETGHVRPPLAGRHGFYALVELELGRGCDADAVEAWLGGCMEEGTVEDGVLARSLADAQGLWSRWSGSARRSCGPGSRTARWCRAGS
ncbi:FAD-binding oxidoreductase [Mangrovicoccus ximenensis]|uniref:FAD-binding oxidoreductase n=1 Tax=Mangrovicoccus ximenensis TaxID=1911570 RepID=UPI00191C6C08|nr:FAD-binding oxidoreductase [Mangrovicoccus ximenensis]